MAKRNFSAAKNAGKVGDIINSSNMTGNAATVVDLDLNLIDENPDNEKIFDMGNIDELAENIEQYGFTGAIEVYKKEDVSGRYELSSGHRRFRAMKQLGRATIPAIIKKMPDEATRRHMLITSNTLNRELSYMDKARAIKYERDTYTMELASESGAEWSQNSDGEIVADVPKNVVMDKLSNEFKMSVNQIYKYLALLNADERIIDLIEQRRIPLDCVNLTINKNINIQNSIYDAIKTELSYNDSGENVSTLSLKQCKSIIKEILRREKIGINDSYPAYTGARNIQTPTDIDFSAPNGGKLFEDNLFSGQEIDFSVKPDNDLTESDPNDTQNIPESDQSQKESPAALVRKMLGEDQDSKQEDETSVEVKKFTEPEAQEYHNYIDNTIFTLTGQMSLLVRNEYDIQDKEKTLQYIEKLEDILRQIKEKL